jgi:hypothetical protein
MKDVRKSRHAIDILSLRRFIYYYDKRIHKVRVKKERHIDKMASKLPADHLALAARGLPMYEDLREAGDPDYLAAAKYRTMEQHLVIGRHWVLITRQIYMWLLVVAIIFVISQLLPNLGRAVQRDYYVALSQIYPVLLIALYLSPNGKYPESDRRNPVIHLGTISDKLAGIVGILLGICVCLVVLANGHSSSFLFMLTLSTIIFTVYTFFGSLKRD